MVSSVSRCCRKYSAFLYKEGHICNLFVNIYVLKSNKCAENVEQGKEVKLERENNARLFPIFTWDLLTLRKIHPRIEIH